MSKAELSSELLHALVDEELFGEERARVLALVNDDAAYVARYAELSKLKSILATLPQANPDKGSWKNCVRRLDAIDKSKRAEYYVGKYSWGLAGLVFCVIVSGSLMNRFGGHRLDTGDVTKMASSMAPFTPEFHPATNFLGKWLEGVVGPAPVKAPASLKVVSAQAGSVEGRKMARVLLADSAGQMVLLVIPTDEAIDGMTPMAGDGDFGSGTMGGFNCVAWHQNGFAMVLLGNRDAQTLRASAEQITFK